MSSFVRSSFALLLSTCLILFGVVRRAREKALSEECILSLYFHNPSQSEFESCIKWLISHHFVFINLSDLEKIILKQMPFPKGGVVLTVDDGWKSNEENIVEISNKFNIPVAIFISTEPVEKGIFWWSYVEQANIEKVDCPTVDTLKRVTNTERVHTVNDIQKHFQLEREAMTIEQVKRISKSKNITIGSHTHSHPILPQCSEAQVLEEVEVSKRKLEIWTERSISSFAYPNGSYTNREISILEKHNFKLAFTTKPMYLTNSSLNNKFELPRFEILNNVSFAENICRMVGVWEPLLVKLKNYLKL